MVAASNWGYRQSEVLGHSEMKVRPRYSAERDAAYKPRQSPPDSYLVGFCFLERSAMSEQTGVVQDLLEALKALLHAMEMQERRETEQLHITSEVAWHIWSEAKDKATTAIARAEGQAE